MENCSKQHSCAQLTAMNTPTLFWDNLSSLVANSASKFSCKVQLELISCHGPISFGSGFHTSRPVTENTNHTALTAVARVWGRGGMGTRIISFTTCNQSGFSKNKIQNLPTDAHVVWCQKKTSVRYLLWLLSALSFTKATGPSGKHIPSNVLACLSLKHAHISFASSSFCMHSLLCLLVLAFQAWAPPSIPQQLSKVRTASSFHITALCS